MSKPITHERSNDETKVFDGLDHNDHKPGHAVPNNDKKPQESHGDHGAPQMDIPPIGTGRAILFIAAFVLLFVVLFFLGLFPTIRDRRLAKADADSAANGKPVVGIIQPKAPTTIPTLEVPGDAQAFATTAIYPRTNGYLKKLMVDIGDEVKDGQLLAEIDTPEVDAQLAAAEAMLQQAQASEQKAKDDYDLAEATYQRYESFSKTGGVTQQQLDEKRSAFTSAKSTLAGAEATVKADEAEVQRLSALQGFEKIYAPFAGTINTRGYDVGALLSATGGGQSGREMFTISQTNMLRVFVDVPQSYATFLKLKEPVKFAVRNYPGKLFEGYIARTSGSINQTTRTLRVEADFPNSDGSLFPGMYGTLQYKPHEQSKHLIIPSNALVFGADGMRVAVVDDQNRVHFKKIVLGSDLGTDVEVTNGLTESDRIVANPGERLSENTEVAASLQAGAAGPASGTGPAGQSADGGKTAGSGK